MSDRSDILLTLFNTLTKAFDRTETATNTLISQQGDLVNHIKNLNLNEIQQSLKEHDKSATDDIETCTETVESKSDIILEEVRILKQKVRTMIIVVMVAFTLFGSALLIGGIVIQNPTTDATHDELQETIKNLENQIKTLHQNGEKTK